VVSVVGEPGVGKTRLLAEFHPEGDPREVRVTCGGEKAFGPIIDLVSQLLGAAPDDVAELERRAAALEIDAPAVAGLAPLFGLGTAPSTVRLVDEQQKRETFAGVWQFLLAVCRDVPALVIVDDVHWSDASSRELLGFLLERLAGARLMLVLGYRPGLEAVQRAELRASHTAVRLEPLTVDESLTLARGFLSVGDIPPDLEQLVASRAGGNPFFIEELLQALLEVRALEVVDGRAALATVELEVPDTVQGTILARIDRLEARERDVLHHAAILGRSFPVDLVEAVVGRGSSRTSSPRSPAPSSWSRSRPDNGSFKHDLIREVAYETLLLRRRRELHAKAAEALESRVGDDPGHLEALAEHYARAEIHDKARRYAVAAGDVAQARMGFAEAERRYQSALGLWGEGDEEGRLQLLMKLAHAAMLGGNSTTARTAFIGAEEGWRRLGDLRRAGAALAGLGRTLWAAGETERSADALNRAISLLEGLGPSRELVQAYAWLSTLRMLEGMSQEASELAETALPLAEQLGLDAPRSDLLNTLGVCEVYSGREEGLERLELAFAIARESGVTSRRSGVATPTSPSVSSRSAGCKRPSRSLARESMPWAGRATPLAPPSSPATRRGSCSTSAGSTKPRRWWQECSIQGRR
jgi:adenylate cyclase